MKTRTLDRRSTYQTLFIIFVLLILSVLAGSACSRQKIVVAQSEFSVDPTAINFGVVYQYVKKQFAVKVMNTSFATSEISIKIANPIFASSENQFTLGGGETRIINISVLASQAGQQKDTAVFDDGTLQVQLELSADVHMNPTCLAPTECLQYQFDSTADSCVAVKAPDGTACNADPCLKDGHCLDGVCRGSQKNCDDGNACTVDSCGNNGECFHQDQSQTLCDPQNTCSLPDPCTSYSCDPKKGCVKSPAMDGTSCGANDCLVAHVCVAGECVERAAPSGSSCGEEFPCQPIGKCENQKCVQPAVSAITPEWIYPIGNYLRGRVVADVGGNLFFIAQGAALGQSNLISLDPHGVIRWSKPLKARKVSPSEYPFSLLSVSGNILFTFFEDFDKELLAFDTVSGSELWRAQFGPGWYLDRSQWLVVTSGTVVVTVVRFDSSYEFPSESYDKGQAKIVDSGLAVLDQNTGAIVRWIPATKTSNEASIGAFCGLGGDEFLYVDVYSNASSLVLANTTRSVASTTDFKGDFFPTCQGRYLITADLPDGGAAVQEVDPHHGFSRRTLYSSNSRFYCGPSSVSTAQGTLVYESEGGEGFFALGLATPSIKPTYSSVGTVYYRLMASAGRNTYSISDDVSNVGTFLGVIDTQTGDLKVECPLQIPDYYNYTFEPGSLLTNGHLVIFDYGVDATPFLISYPLNGVTPAPHGWVSMYGNAQGTNSIR